MILAACYFVWVKVSFFECHFGKEDEEDPDDRHDDPGSDMEMDYVHLWKTQHDASRATAEHRGPEPMVEDVGPSKQIPLANANAMAVDEPGNIKPEPRSSTKLLNPPAIYQKP